MSTSINPEGAQPTEVPANLSITDPLLQCINLVARNFTLFKTILPYIPVLGQCAGFCECCQLPEGGGARAASLPSTPGYGFKELVLEDDEMVVKYGCCGTSGEERWKYADIDELTTNEVACSKSIRIVNVDVTRAGINDDVWDIVPSKKLSDSIYQELLKRWEEKADPFAKAKRIYGKASESMGITHVQKMERHIKSGDTAMSLKRVEEMSDAQIELVQAQMKETPADQKQLIESQYIVMKGKKGRKSPQKDQHEAEVLARLGFETGSGSKYDTFASGGGFSLNGAVTSGAALAEKVGFYGEG